MIDNFLSRLNKVRPRGENKWQACCPAHDDRSPSMSIEDTGDKILVRCHAECSVDDIMTAVGLTVSDLFREPMSAEKRAEKKAYYSAEQRWMDELLITMADDRIAEGKKIDPGSIQSVLEAKRRLDANN